MDTDGRKRINIPAQEDAMTTISGLVKELLDEENMISLSVFSGSTAGATGTANLNFTKITQIGERGNRTRIERTITLTVADLLKLAGEAR